MLLFKTSDRLFNIKNLFINNMYYYYSSTTGFVLNEIYYWKHPGPMSLVSSELETESVHDSAQHLFFPFIFEKYPELYLWNKIVNYLTTVSVSWKSFSQLNINSYSMPSRIKGWISKTFLELGVMGSSPKWDAFLLFFPTSAFHNWGLTQLQRQSWIVRIVTDCRTGDTGSGAHRWGLPEMPVARGCHTSSFRLYAWNGNKPSPFRDHCVSLSLIQSWLVQSKVCF